MRSVLPNLVVHIALLLPLAGLASEADFPALGVSLKELPDLAMNPATHERPMGYEADANFTDGTFLNIYRQDQPVASGDLSDANYRSSVLAPLGAPEDWHDKGSATQAGGNKAWVTLHIVRFGSLTTHRIALYVLADNHAYRFIVTGQGVTPPPGFDAVVNSIQANVSFHVVERNVDDDWTLAKYPDREPRFVSAGINLYPAAALRRSDDGTVVVEYGIDGTGHATGLKVVHADHGDLGEVLPEYFKQSVFRVPSDWVQAGADQKRFTMKFRFVLPRNGVGCPASPSDSSHEVVVCAHVKRL